MDDKDQKLLSLLRENARLSTSELARKMGLSRTTVQDRMARLEDRGVIAGYTIRLGDKGDQKVRAIVMFKIRPRTQAAVVSRIKSMMEVFSLYSISGDNDLCAVVGAENTSALDRALDKLGAIEGVERTRSSIMLSTKFER